MASAPVTPVDPRSAAYANAASATRPSSCESSSLARSAICTPRKNASRRVRPPSRRSRCGPHNAPRIDFGVMFRLRGVFKGSIVWKHLVHGKGNNTQHNPTRHWKPKAINIARNCAGPGHEIDAEPVQHLARGVRRVHGAHIKRVRQRQRLEHGQIIERKRRG
jgi:hypothetical protein